MLAALRSSAPAQTTLLRGAAGVSAAYLALFVLGRLRLLPRRVAQAYWISLAVPFLVVGRVGAELLNLVGYALGYDEDRRRGLANWAFCGSHSWWQRCCGHITFKMDEESQRVWRGVSTKEASVVLMNHQCFYDALIIGVFAPWAYRANVKVLYMARMDTWPLFGPCFKLCGHFPVYFTKYVEGSFKVDDRQAAVTERMVAYIRRGGRLMLFPEATLNPKEDTLLPFRTGTFKMLVQERVPVYMLTLRGPAQSWPKKAAIGGFPADITMKFTKFETRYEVGESPEQMADRARDVMQAQLATH